MKSLFHGVNPDIPEVYLDKFSPPSPDVMYGILTSICNGAFTSNSWCQETIVAKDAAAVLHTSASLVYIRVRGKKS